MIKVRPESVLVENRPQLDDVPESPDEQSIVIKDDSLNASNEEKKSA